MQNENRKEVWVLGGASGLGKKLVDKAPTEGVDRVVLGRGGDYEVDLSSHENVGALCEHIESLTDEAVERVAFFVWNASVLELGPFADSARIEEILNINVLNPTLILRALLKAKKRVKSSLHLITISSVASWKARSEIALYCATKAYQAQISRSLAPELEPGSKVTIAMPAGMKTDIFRSTPVDVSGFMDPGEVAEVIWQEALSQEALCDWFNVLKGEEGPVVSREKFAPEIFWGKLPKHNPKGETQ